MHVMACVFVWSQSATSHQQRQHHAAFIPDSTQNTATSKANPASPITTCSRSTTHISEAKERQKANGRSLQQLGMRLLFCFQAGYEVPAYTLLVQYQHRA
jgi:hypothetical protein